MSRPIRCSVCGQPCEHTRGYLHEHEVTVTRGEIQVGTKMCDGSNSKPDVPLQRVRYQGNCPGCGEYHFHEDEETYPGSLAQYGGTIMTACNSCTTLVPLSDQHVIAEERSTVS